MDRGTLAFVLGLGIVLAVAGAGGAHADETWPRASRRRRHVSA